MTPAQWKQTLELFEAASTLVPEEAVRLLESSNADPAVLREVARLLEPINSGNNPPRPPASGPTAGRSPHGGATPGSDGWWPSSSWRRNTPEWKRPRAVSCARRKRLRR
jgi:hypothetical protein